MTDNNTVPEHCYSFSTFPIIFFSTCVANHLKYRIELSHVNFVFIENVIATFSRCNGNFTYETFFKLTLLKFCIGLSLYIPLTFFFFLCYHSSKDFVMLKIFDLFQLHYAYFTIHLYPAIDFSYFIN